MKEVNLDETLTIEKIITEIEKLVVLNLEGEELKDFQN
jgi:hypothetical protein